MVLPVGQRRALAREPALEQIPEGPAARVDVPVAAAEEDHRDVERPHDVAAVGSVLEPRREDEGERPAARRIRLAEVDAGIADGLHALALITEAPGER